MGRIEKRSFALAVTVTLWLAGMINVTAALPAEQNVFDQLVDMSKAEMAKNAGKLSAVLEMNPSEMNPVLDGFRKQFSFVKEFTYDRMNRTEEFQRMIIESQAGRPPSQDVLHVQFEAWPQMRDAGMFKKPPFLYTQLAKSLPKGWHPPDPRAIDPNGYYLSTSALIRIIAYNKNTVPADKAPKSYGDCLDPMWRGKFLYNVRSVLTPLQHDPKTREAHLKWLKGIVENKAVYVRQQTEGLEKLAAGEYHLFCGVNYTSTIRMIREGAPLGLVFPDPYAMDFAQRLHILKWSKNPATGQLFAVWTATKGQPLVEKHTDRGFPWSPGTESHTLAKGKYAAVCEATCAAKMDEYLAEHAKLLGLPGGKS
jgi:ABC-type Fe3+ transport system substrate-binding protein